MALSALSSVIVVLTTGGVAGAVKDIGTREREQLRQSLFGIVDEARGRESFASLGGWRIQVGTFRSKDSALARLKLTTRRVPELVHAGARTSAYGALVRARFVGLPDAASASAICTKVVASGVGCFVLPPR